MEVSKKEEKFMENGGMINRLIEEKNKNLYGVAFKFKEICDEAIKRFRLTRKQVYTNLEKESKRMTIGYYSFCRYIDLANFVLEYPKFRNYNFEVVLEIAKNKDVFVEEGF